LRNKAKKVLILTRNEIKLRNKDVSLNSQQMNQIWT
jgi:hypothetical protein